VTDIIIKKSLTINSC